MLCAFTAATGYTLGPAVQKSALNRLPPLPSHSLVLLLRLPFGDRRWRSGFVLGVAGVLPNLAAVSLIGLAVCLQIISQLFASRGYVLPRDLLAVPGRLSIDPVYVLVLGVACAGLTASAAAYSLQQLGLQRNRTTLFNPILNSVSLVGAVTIGLAVFAQTLSRKGLYALAMAAALGGIALLSAPARRRDAAARRCRAAPACGAAPAYGAATGSGPGEPPLTRP